jgi:ATP-dependent Lhr-like helicase
MVSAEGMPGGFGPIYKVLSALEETGRARRGYFIEGLSGAQFARPGTVDLLRGLRPGDDPDPDELGEDMVFLPAVDPANPWGSLLPWPETGDLRSNRRPRRVAGAWILLCRGRPLLYLGAGGRHLSTFPASLAPPGMASAAFEALSRLPRSTRRRTLIIEKIDGRAVTESEYLELILRCGFERDYRGVAAEVFS